MLPEEQKVKEALEQLKQLKDAAKPKKAKGKYGEVVKTLPKLEQPRSERVEKLRLEFLEKSPAELTNIYATLRADKDALESAISTINESIEAVTQLIINSYDDQGISTLKLSDGKSVSVQQEPVAQVKDRDTFRRWAIEHGYENSLALPWQTTNAITKALLLDGQPPPAGVEAYVLSKLVLRSK